PPARGGEWLAEPSATSGAGGGRDANSGAGLARTSADPPQHPPLPVSRGAACDAASRMWPRRSPTDAVPDPSHAASRPLTPPRTGASVVPQWLIYLAGDARRVGDMRPSPGFCRRRVNSSAVDSFGPGLAEYLVMPGVCWWCGQLWRARFPRSVSFRGVSGLRGVWTAPAI